MAHIWWDILTTPLLLGGRVLWQFDGLDLVCNIDWMVQILPMFDAKRVLMTTYHKLPFNSEDK
jgi:hypothetical protein